MDAKQLREAISEMYSQLDYFKFCEYMGFNPKYDERYWRDFQNLVNAVSTFDNERLQKILDYGTQQKTAAN